jgi:hypothetical protein
MPNQTPILPDKESSQFNETINDAINRIIQKLEKHKDDANYAINRIIKRLEKQKDDILKEVESGSYSVSIYIDRTEKANDEGSLKDEVSITFPKLEKQFVVDNIFDNTYEYDNSDNKELGVIQYHKEYDIGYPNVRYDNGYLNFNASIDKNFKFEYEYTNPVLRPVPPIKLNTQGSVGTQGSVDIQNIKGESTSQNKLSPQSTSSQEHSSEEKKPISSSKIKKVVDILPPL